jgi:hypothetical protein
LDDLICVVFGLISIALVGSGSDKIILNSLWIRQVGGS